MVQMLPIGLVTHEIQEILLGRSYRLFRNVVAPGVLVGGLVDVGVAGVQGLVLLLLRHFLDGQEPVLTHLDTLCHVAHACVLCKEKSK